MINSKNLSEKKQDTDGKVLFNSNTVTIDFENVRIIDYVLIDEFTEMRMDIVSKAAYGTVDKIEELKKFNGIKDAKTIQRGDVLAIPDLQSLADNTTIRNMTSIKLQNNGLIGRTSGVDESAPNSSNARSTPSKKTSPSANFTKRDDGVIIF